MLKKKIKQYTPARLWFFLFRVKKSARELKVRIILKRVKSNTFFFRFLTRNKCKKIVWLDTLQSEEIFKEAELVDIYEPNYYGAQKKTHVLKPAVALYLLHDADVHCESSHIVLNESIVMERLPDVPVECCNYSAGYIEGHNDSFSVYRFSSEYTRLEKAFFLGGNGSWNYYHWTVEIITKLYYFFSSTIKDSGMKLIVPEHVKKIKSFLVMIDLIVAGRCEIIYLPDNQVIHVKQLYLINTPSNLVFNYKKDFVFSSGFVYFDKESIDFVRNSVLGSSCYDVFLNDYNDRSIFRKVYLARKEGAARNYNQKDVINIALKYGFKPIYLEDFSFFEQVYIFQSVEFVIGASGAAWTNLIYINESAKAISWLNDNVKGFSVYSTLAKYYNCDLRFLQCKVSDSESVHSDYIVDLNDFEGLIINLLGN